LNRPVNALLVQVRLVQWEQDFQRIQEDKKGGTARKEDANVQPGDVLFFEIESAADIPRCLASRMATAAAKKIKISPLCG
jgi:hypothetical protein